MKNKKRHSDTVQLSSVDISMAVPTKLELSELGKNVNFKRQTSEIVFFHEKTQKLLKYARAKDKQDDLEKELEVQKHLFPTYDAMKKHLVTLIHNRAHMHTHSLTQSD